MQMGLSTHLFKFHVGQDFVGCLLLILPGFLDAYVHRAEFALSGVAPRRLRGAFGTYPGIGVCALLHGIVQRAI